MSVFKCKMCGASLEVGSGQRTVVCQYCGTNQTLPKLNNDKIANLYERANHFRRNNEFDRALSIYESILNEDGTDAEAYWSIVLCRYGVEYIEDPASKKRVPTINRTQFTSIFDDDNYKSALGLADDEQKAVYRAEAEAINEIQKGILAISQKEEPFDIFICYKETDKDGRRTIDSVLAFDIYKQLTQEGFKVFFSRVTLEDKLGIAYEPYIFAALNSAKVMVVLGTKPEYFNAVWVKNEWSRFLSLVKESKGQKILIPAYKDMNPYDLPEEFSHLQAQDMSKIGFIQDLVMGISKIVTYRTGLAELNQESGPSIDSLLKRISLFLEDKDWKSADQYCERILDVDPENGEAYLYKLLAGHKCSNKEALIASCIFIEKDKNYNKIMRFGDEQLKLEVKKLSEDIYKVFYSQVNDHLRRMQWEEANDLCYKVLAAEPDNGDAYFYLMLSEFRCEKAEELRWMPFIEYSENYKSFMLYGNEHMKQKVSNFVGGWLYRNIKNFIAFCFKMVINILYIISKIIMFFIGVGLFFALIRYVFF